MRTCIYLRKSREDVEKEELGINTLSTHKNILLDYAKKSNLNITDIKEEIVSGGQLFTRPKMLELLKDIEKGRFDAVLCMDIDRLGRSGMKEQGIILETMKSNDVKIITPNKTYDLNNENDELQTELYSFIARVELNTIKNRMMRGRLQSLKEGYYISGIAPFGYKKVKVGNRNSLEIDPEQAEVIKLIFKLYVYENMGTRRICDKLKNMGINNASMNTLWSTESIKKIIHNPVYTGKVVYKQRTYTRTKSGIKARQNNDCLIYEGKHKAIIDADLWNKAQEISKKRYIVPQRKSSVLRNPLAGLIKCSCGYAMYLKRDNKAYRLTCSKKCGTAGTNIIRVEEQVIILLNDAFNNIRLTYGSNSNLNLDMLTFEKLKIEESLRKKATQMNTLYELLEQNIYDIDRFTKRSIIIKSEIESMKKALSHVNIAIEKEQNSILLANKLAPELENIANIYTTLDSTAKKNVLLKSIINVITYSKDKNVAPDEFSLTIDIKGM